MAFFAEIIWLFIFFYFVTFFFLAHIDSATVHQVNNGVHFVEEEPIVLRHVVRILASDEKHLSESLDIFFPMYFRIVHFSSFLLSFLFLSVSPLFFFIFWLLLRLPLLVRFFVLDDTVAALWSVVYCHQLMRQHQPLSIIYDRCARVVLSKASLLRPWYGDIFLQRVFIRKITVKKRRERKEKTVLVSGSNAKANETAGGNGAAENRGMAVPGTTSASYMYEKREHVKTFAMPLLFSFGQNIRLSCRSAPLFD